MLRRLFHIFLSLLLLISTSGVVLSKHYCGGVLFNVSVYLTPDTCCDNTCESCNSENIIIQIEDDFSIEEFKSIYLDFSVKLISGIGRYVEFPGFNKFVISTDLLEPPPDTIDVILSKYQTYLC